MQKNTIHFGLGDYGRIFYPIPFFPGEKDLSATLSPGGKSSFAFARKTKKIPAALKEVTRLPL